MLIKTLCPNCHSAQVTPIADNQGIPYSLNQTLLSPSVIESISTGICKTYQLPPLAGMAITTVTNIAISLVQAKFTPVANKQMQCQSCQHIFTPSDYQTTEPVNSTI